MSSLVPWAFRVFHSGVAGFVVFLLASLPVGYLFGFIGAALVVGLAYESTSVLIRISGIAPVTVIYACGIAWLMFSFGAGLIPAVTAGLLPFIPVK